MKTLYQIICIIVSLIIAISCAREPLIESISGQDTVLTFRAYASGQQSKAQLNNDGRVIIWNVADSINVFYGDKTSGKFVSTNTEPTGYAEFTGSLKSFTGTTNEGSSSNPFWAIYPYSADNSCDGSSVTMSLPSNQSANLNSFDPYSFPTVARSENLDLAFYNVCGGIRFKLTHYGIRQVILRGKENEILAGKIQVGLDKDGIPEVLQVESPQLSVQLTAPAGDEFQVGEWYYLVCLPTELKEGFTLEFRGGGKKGIYSHMTSVTVKRSGWGELTDVDSDVTFEEDEDWDDYLDLSSNETANSYIINTPGRYGFNVLLAGNGNGGLLPDDGFPTTATLDPDSVEILWSTGDLVIKDVSFSGTRAIFDYVGGKGNALIAARQNGEIIWSWHIWATERPELIEMDGYSFMDRNLGASSVEHSNQDQELGLFYQFGRKDPFRGQDYNLEFEQVSGDEILQRWIKNPNVFYFTSENQTEILSSLWGNPDGYFGGQGVKTIYDPCPPGYTVPDCAFAELYQPHHYTYDGTYIPFTDYVIDNTGLLLRNKLWLPSGGSWKSSVFETQAPGYDLTTSSYLTNTKRYSISIYSDSYNLVLISPFTGGNIRCVRNIRNSENTPSVRTVSIESVRDTTATIVGEILSNGNSRILSYGVRWGNTKALDHVYSIGGNPSNHELKIDIDGLPINETVYFQVFAVNEIGTGYGEILSVKTLSKTELAKQDLEEVYKLMYHWGWTTSGNYHQCFGILSSTLAAEVMGDDFVMNDAGNGWFWYDFTYTVKYRFNSNAWRSQDLWVQYYTYVERANRIIDSLEDCDHHDKPMYFGQALAIRAYAYFMLAQWFSRTYIGHETDKCVPLLLTYPESLSPNKPRASVRDVYARICEDIDLACTLLNDVEKHPDKKVIDKYVANAIRAKVYLETGRYQDAYESAKIAVQGASIDFDPDFHFNDASHPGVLWGASLTSLEGTTNPQFMAHMDYRYGSYGARSRKCISSWLYRKINPEDKRAASWWKYESLNDGSLGYQQYKFLFRDPSNPQLGDRVYLRASDMQLILAETACRLGKEAEAKAYLNELIQKRDPQYDCSNKMGQELGALTTDETGSLLEEIILQRRIELWGESGRIFDIKRLKQGFDRSRIDNFPASATLSSMNTKSAESYDWVMTIPSSAFEANPAMNPETDQNPL